MKKKIRYTDEKLFLGKKVSNLIPSPEEILLDEKNVKVTLNLSQRSINSLKKMAEEKEIPYQKIIRNLVDKFVENYQAV